MRLIDADQVWKIMPKTHTPTWIAVKGIIASMPTVDAVPVVRCKDCVNRNSRPDPFMEGRIQCKISGAWHPMDGYCQSGMSPKQTGTRKIEAIKKALAAVSKICRSSSCVRCPFHYVDKAGIPQCPMYNADETLTPAAWDVDKLGGEEE